MIRGHDSFIIQIENTPKICAQIVGSLFFGLFFIFPNNTIMIIFKVDFIEVIWRKKKVNYNFYTRFYDWVKVYRGNNGGISITTKKKNTHVTIIFCSTNHFHREFGIEKKNKKKYNFFHAYISMMILGCWSSSRLICVSINLCLCLLFFLFHNFSQFRNFRNFCCDSPRTHWALRLNSNFGAIHVFTL